jgi:hypothetical protein
MDTESSMPALVALMVKDMAAEQTPGWGCSIGYWRRGSD